MKKDKRFGTVYGQLVNFKDVDALEFSFHDWNGTSLINLANSLYDAGVAEIWFDVEITEDDNLDSFCATMFFKVGATPNWPALLSIIGGEMRPHELSEETKNHWRMWFD